MQDYCQLIRNDDSNRAYTKAGIDPLFQVDERAKSISNCSKTPVVIA